MTSDQRFPLVFMPKMLPRSSQRGLEGEFVVEAGELWWRQPVVRPDLGGGGQEVGGGAPIKENSAAVKATE